MSPLAIYQHTKTLLKNDLFEGGKGKEGKERRERKGGRGRKEGKEGGEGMKRMELNLAEMVNLYHQTRTICFLSFVFMYATQPESLAT